MKNAGTRSLASVGALLLIAAAANGCSSGRTTASEDGAAEAGNDVGCLVSPCPSGDSWDEAACACVPKATDASDAGCAPSSCPPAESWDEATCACVPKANEVSDAGCGVSRCAPADSSLDSPPVSEASVRETDGGLSDATAPDGSDAACFATCSTAAGLVHTFASVEEVYTALEGRWQFCGSNWSSAFPSAPADAIGVEYGPATVTDASCGLTGGGNCGGGAMYYLVQSSSGPARGMGFAYQLTYDVSPNGTYFQLNMHPLPNSGFGGSFEYSPCPTELLIMGFSGNATLVPF